VGTRVVFDGLCAEVHLTVEEPDVCIGYTTNTKTTVLRQNEEWKKNYRLITLRGITDLSTMMKVDGVNADEVSLGRRVNSLRGNFLDASNSGIVTGVTRCADE
jgi:hypothetical protein